VAKLLIDECLHTSLLELAHAAGHIADHVTYLGLGSSKDRELVKFSVERDYTFVTNNRSDFLALYRRTPLHAGLVNQVPTTAGTGPTTGHRRPFQSTTGPTERIPGALTSTSKELTNPEWQDMPDLTYNASE
jgi:hypothetical protein